MIVDIYLTEDYMKKIGVQSIIGFVSTEAYMCGKNIGNVKEVCFVLPKEQKYYKLPTMSIDSIISGVLELTSRGIKVTIDNIG